MITNKSRFVPKYTPNNVKELVAAPFKEISAGMQQISALRARQDELRRKERQSQYDNLYKVSNKSREGWSLGHNKEFQDQYEQSLKRVMDAPTAQAQDLAHREETNFLTRIYDRFENHARIRQGQNSKRDEYVEYLGGEKAWNGMGTPLLSEDDLRFRDALWENNTINLRPEQIKGRQINVGDYIDPRGRNIREFTEGRFVQDGIQYTEQTDEDGVTFLIPNGNPDNKVMVSGPTYFHPFLGANEYYMPNSIPTNITPLEFADMPALRNLESSLNRQVNSDGANRITTSEAQRTMLQTMTTLYNSNDQIEKGAMSLYEQEYGIPYDSSDFEIDQETGQSIAEVEGRQTPKQLFLNRALQKRSGFNLNIPRASSGGQNQLLFANVEKTESSGLPDNVNFSAEEVARYNLYGDKSDTLRGLIDESRIDMIFPEEINLQFNGEKVNTIRMFADEGIVLVERVNADDVGEPQPGFDLNDSQDLEDLYGDLFNTPVWKKKPEAKYFIIPIFGSDGAYSDEFKKIEENVVDEYKRAGDIQVGSKPLRTIYARGI